VLCTNAFKRVREAASGGMPSLQIRTSQTPEFAGAIPRQRAVRTVRRA